MKRAFSLIILGVLLAAASGAWAAVELRYTPADSTLEPGQTARISIVIDEPIDLRTIEVYVDFDPAVIATLDGGSGTLFTDSGFFLFDGFEETEPGTWHGYCVVMGADDWITGPGELFFWEVGTVSEGVSPITTASVALAAPDASVLADVTLPSTTIGVQDPASGVGDLPAAAGLLEVFPNPFNPRTEVRFALTETAHARLDVLDAAGRRVAVLHDGALPAGTASFTWNGKSDSGLPLSAGAYFFRLTTARGISVQKGMLVK